MSLKTPLAATVVGALLLGGATTGTTLALWRDGATVDDGSLIPGYIGLTAVGSPTAISNLGLNNNAGAGDSQVFAEQLGNTGKGKNLRMRVYLDGVSSTSDSLSRGLEIAVISSSTSTCPQPSSFSNYASLSSFHGVDLTGTALAPGETRTMCAAVRVQGGAAGTIASQSGQLTFSYHGQQVRPTGAVAGWTALASDTISVSTSASFSLSCGAYSQPTQGQQDSAYSITWTSAGGATAYQVYMGSQAIGSPKLDSDRSYAVPRSAVGTYTVKALKGATVLATSNGVTVARDGNALKCTVTS